MTKTAFADPEFGCLWCGKDLPEDDKVFCDIRCRESWFISDES